ncbi:response regulator [uncultured Rhodoblastus sp.]|uniref:response regulator n=1 Tax=uncultured Rhodoblastus sp. TaxID=543037 RepID=UPI0025E6801C|nr:response regulator [uncultured Rhodoblastus sp.]
MQKLRVMIVEDDEMIAGLLAELIEALGYEVCAVESSENGAVAAARHSRPDLMIVDAHLQNGSGMGAVDRINGSETISHIYVTGDAKTVKILKPDATVLQKPYFELDLVLAIQSALTQVPAH